MKVALVHDHLTQNGGAERVLEALQAMWPEAPTFTLLYDKKAVGSTFGHRNIQTSFLQKMPLSLKRPRWYLPLMPMATESYNLKNFDVIISSSSAFSKGIVPPTESLHICYCHTPTRYLWSNTHDYLTELNVPGPIKKLLPPVLSWLRTWDKLAADRVDYFIANSETVNRRISKYYQKSSFVIHPPVDIDQFEISDRPKEYYLIGGRLVYYKRYDLVIDAFNKLGLPLVVFGSGPMEKALKQKAEPNIKFLGRVSDQERAKLFADAIAFINPQEEDFGITPVESMAAGRPVIAYRKGGAIETIIDGVTGVLFDSQCWEEIADTILQFDHTNFDPKKIREHAEQYSLQNFRKNMHGFVNEKWNEHSRSVLGLL
ncbi:MAG: glycosyltransferase [Candidatus Uhrbacteria bacterium]|nr:glycosyltransferase [Candidatus Uhrbacteria bacterium]